MHSLSISEQKRYSLFFGSGFLIFTFFAIILIFIFSLHNDREIWTITEFFLRVVISISAAGFTAMLPGFFNIDWQKRFGLRAGGSFAVLVLIYTVNPPGFAKDISKEIQSQSLFSKCDTGIAAGELPTSVAQNTCITLMKLYPNEIYSHIAAAKLNISLSDYRSALNHSMIAYGLFYSQFSSDPIAVLEKGESDTTQRSIADEIVDVLESSFRGIGAERAALPFVSARSQFNSIDLNFKFKKLLSDTLSVVYDPQIGIKAGLATIRSNPQRWERLYDACILSWYSIFYNDTGKMNDAKSELLKFEKDLQLASGSKVPAQLHYIECLKKYGPECEYKIGYPRVCPVLKLP